ncbi:MAG: holo-ACP synthase [Magnetococcales bacterium]|nr:holo-ACP synthase [Magnetococcales bacterium]
MILGIGTDLVPIVRIEQAMNRFEDRFARRVFTGAEQSLCGSRKSSAACFAKRFAAKEALVKALGQGIRQGIWFTDVETLNDDVGKPLMTLSGEAERRLQAILLACHCSVATIHVTLADDGGFALAYVILEGR